jgi:outer membrane protein assembly factor BamB
MKKETIVSLALIALFLMSVFPLNNLSDAFRGSLRVFGAQSAVDPVDWWPMFHHDQTHMGYSNSTAPNTNQILWNHTTGNSVDSSPAVVGGVVFVGSDDGKVYALNASTGALVWNYTTGGYVYSSPAVAGGIVYVGSLDYKVYALNASTGALVWNYTTGSYVYSSPAVANGIVYVGSMDYKVYALNASTGALVWNYTTGNWVTSSPAVAGGKVFVGSTDGKVYALNGATGAYMWSYATGGSVYLSSPAVTGGDVYVGSYDHRVYALNAATGALIWNYTTGNPVASSPAAVGGTVFVGSTDGNVYALNASTGILVWSYATGGYASSSPAVAGGKVFVGSTDGKVYALNASTGALVWSYATGGYVASSPAIADGVVFVGSEDGKVYAFGQRLSVSISPSSVLMDFGQSQLFTSNVMGETSPYTYQWYLNGAPVSGATTPTWTFTPTSAGSYVVYVNLTDALGHFATSGTVQVTVNLQPSVSVLPASGTLDVGQSQLFTSNVSGGTPPYSYQWYLNSAAVSGAASSNWTFTPASAGSYTVYLNVTDSVGAVATSGTVPVTVNGPLSVSIAPSSATMDVGQQKLFTSTVSGGTSPFMYQWYANDVAASGATNAAWAFTPSSSGTYNVYVNVTDNVRFKAKSNIANVVVNPALSVSVSPSAVVMDVNQSQLFTSSVTGGTWPYTYQWYLNGTSVSGATDTMWNFTLASAGNYTIYVGVNDGAGAQATSNTATVNFQLSVSVLPASATLDVGQSQLFTSNVSGGATPYSYQWYLDGTPATGATGPTWIFAPASFGSYTVYVNVTDALGAVATSGTVPVTVNGPLSISIAPSSVTMDVGQQKLFTSTVSGGTSPFSYQWYSNGTAVPGATSSTWNFTPSSSGSYTVYANVTDSVGFTAKSNIATVAVNPALSVGISPTSIVMNVGQSQVFASNVSGGTPPYSYQWYLNDAPVSGAASSNWTFTPTSTGSYTVYAKVNDTIGTQATSNTAHVQAGISDVAVTNVTSIKTMIGRGYGGNITVTVQNQGNFTETFNVTVYANTTSAASQNVTLSSGNSTHITLTWNTTGFVYGNYIMSAYAWPVPGETNTANNNGTDGSTLVTIPGDLNGDFTVGLADLVILAQAYGSRPGDSKWNVNADMDGNGIVGLTDLVILATHYGQHNP